jgi:hypothetical protein
MSVFVDHSVVPACMDEPRFLTLFRTEAVLRFRLLRMEVTEPPLLPPAQRAKS